MVNKQFMEKIEFDCYVCSKNHSLYFYSKDRDKRKELEEAMIFNHEIIETRNKLRYLKSFYHKDFKVVLKNYAVVTIKK